MTPEKLSELKENLTVCKMALDYIQQYRPDFSEPAISEFNPQVSITEIYNHLESYAMWATLKVLEFNGLVNKKCTDFVVLSKTHKLAFEMTAIFIKTIDAVLNEYIEAQHAGLDGLLKQLSALAKDMLGHLNKALKLLASSDVPGYKTQSAQHSANFQRIDQLLLANSLFHHIENDVTDESCSQIATPIFSTNSATLPLLENMHGTQKNTNHWSDWSYQHSDTLPLPADFTALSAESLENLRTNLPIGAAKQDSMLFYFNATIKKLSTHTLEAADSATSSNLTNNASPSQTFAALTLDLPTPLSQPVTYPITLINETLAAIKIFFTTYSINKPRMVEKIETALNTIESEDNLLVLQAIQQIANKQQTISSFFQDLWVNDQRTDQFYQKLKKLDLNQPSTLKNVINFVIQNLDMKSTPIITVQYF